MDFILSSSVLLIPENSVRYISLRFVPANIFGTDRNLGGGEQMNLKSTSFCQSLGQGVAFLRDVEDIQLHILG